MVELNEDNIQNTSEESKRKNQKPLFSDEQRESTVKGFIEAWNIHKIYIDQTRFPTHPPKSLSEMFPNSNMPKKKVTVSNATSAIELRNLIENKIKIASGSTDATPEIRYDIINSLYNDIVDMQGRHYVIGTFLSNEIEDKIFDRVMKKVDEYFIKIKRDSGMEE